MPFWKSANLNLILSNEMVFQAVLRRCGYDQNRKPADVRRRPVGGAGIPDIVPQQEGLELTLGILEIPHGGFPGRERSRMASSSGSGT